VGGFPPLACLVNSVRYPCTYLLTPLRVTITGFPALLASNRIRIGTELTEADLTLGAAGLYSVTVEARVGLTALEKSHSFMRVQAGQLAAFNPLFHFRTAGASCYL
jgi:hypothetical protein